MCVSLHTIKLLSGNENINFSIFYAVVDDSKCIHEPHIHTPSKNIQLFSRVDKYIVKYFVVNQFNKLGSNI